MMKSYLRLPDIQLLSFDLDDTLYDNWAQIRRAEQALQDYLIAHYPAAKQWTNHHWRACRHQQLQQNSALKHDVTLIRQQVLRSALSQWGAAEDEISAQADAALQFFLTQRSDFRISDQVLTLLKRLQSKYRLVAITNGNVDVERIGLGDSFEWVLKPSLSQKMKPAPDLFLLNLQLAQLSAEQCLHIGDNWLSDVQGARRAGYAAAWLSPAFGGAIYSSDSGISRSGMLPHLELSDIQQLAYLL